MEGIKEIKLEISIVQKKQVWTLSHLAKSVCVYVSQIDESDSQQS